MTRHLADQPRDGQGARMARFAAIARRSGPEGAHPAARQLLRQPKLLREDGPSRRVKEFLRIARGHRV